MDTFPGAMILTRIFLVILILFWGETPGMRKIWENIEWFSLRLGGTLLHGFSNVSSESSTSLILLADTSFYHVIKPTLPWPFPYGIPSFSVHTCISSSWHLCFSSSFSATASWSSSKALLSWNRKHHSQWTIFSELNSSIYRHMYSAIRTHAWNLPVY